MTTIKVEDLTNCTWKLEGSNFYCTHDENEIVKYYEDYTMDLYGNIEEIETSGYACAECGEPLEGDPEYDHEDLIAESQLMDILGK